MQAEHENLLDRKAQEGLVDRVNGLGQFEVVPGGVHAIQQSNGPSIKFIQEKMRSYFCEALLGSSDSSPD
jgi:hypothetical protein